LVAVLGVIVPFVVGYVLVELTAPWLLGGHSRIESIFIGAAMVATSVGITARVLGDLGVINATTSRIILGAAVIDDVLGLLILAVVSSLAQGGINYAEIATTAGLAVGFTVFLAVVGSRLMTRLTPRVEKLRVRESYYVVALSLCLGISAVASYVGVAAIIGAFLAGVMLAERAQGTRLLHQSESLMEFLVPFFLVNIGMQLKLEALLGPGVLLMAIGVTVVAVLGKLFGCGLGALKLGWRGAAQVGVGMVPRGEVGIVVAQIGLGLHVISDTMYGIVLFMSVGTTLLAPPFLRRLFKGEPVISHKEPFEEAPIEIE
jgi:Kef-type K+ transport system membrane component KefB